MTDARPFRWAAALAAVGLVACLLPVILWTPPFWGIGPRMSVNNGPPFVDKIVPGSPAATAGLRDDDQVLAVDGRPVTIDGLSRELEQIPEGESRTLLVERKTSGNPPYRTLELRATAGTPVLSRVRSELWQWVTGGLWAVALVTSLVMGPGRRRLWVLTAAGALAALSAVPLQQAFGGYPYYKYLWWGPVEVGDWKRGPGRAVAATAVSAAVALAAFRLTRRERAN